MPCPQLLPLDPSLDGILTNTDEAEVGPVGLNVVHATFVSKEQIELVSSLQIPANQQASSIMRHSQVTSPIHRHSSYCSRMSGHDIQTLALLQVP